MNPFHALAGFFGQNACCDPLASSIKPPALIFPLETSRSAEIDRTDDLKNVHPFPTRIFDASTEHLRAGAGLCGAVSGERGGSPRRHSRPGGCLDAHHLMLTINGVPSNTVTIAVE